MNEWQRAGISVFLSIFLFGLAVLFYLGLSPSVGRFFAIVPGLLWLLMIYNAVHSLLATRNPPTTISLPKTPLKRGSSTSFVIRQSGPIIFDSLRANLICERIVRGVGRNRAVTYPFQINFFDSGPTEVARLDTQDFEAILIIPADGEPSVLSQTLIVEWRIEVWGKVKGRADFMRPFPVEVI